MIENVNIGAIITMNKVVSNLLDDISKARDIISRGDIDEINRKMLLFVRISKNLKRQLKFYVTNPSHELDFTHEDLNELSTEVYEFIKNYQQKFTYKRMYKEITATLPITIETFNKFSKKIGAEFQAHADLTAFYKEIGYLGIVIWLWSQTNDKKPFDEQLTDLIRSFI